MSEEPNDLPDLPESVRALTERARAGGLDDAARARIADRLGLDPGPGGGSSGSPPSSGGAWIAGGGLAAAAAALIYFFGASEPDDTAPRDDAPRVEAAPADPSPAAIVATAVDDPAPAVAVVTPTDEAPAPPSAAAETEIVRPARRRAEERAPSAPPEPESAASPALDEAALLLRARRALASAPRDTLALCEEHASSFPRGQLAHEREVLRIDALRALGREAEARAAARRFLARNPSSPHRAHLDWASDAEESPASQ